MNEEPGFPTTVFMFSGQGSQYFHMGRALFEEKTVFHHWMVLLDDLVRQRTGKSVLETVYSPAHRKGDPFDRTLLTHPAIFMVEYALAQTLIDEGVHPDIVLAVSLGAFAAAAVAGFLAVEDALSAVLQQAMALEQYGEPGGMIAVLADPATFAQGFLCQVSQLASVNFSGHFVISVRQQDLRDIEARLLRENISFQRLPVSLPFHSRWIERAQAPFQSFMETIECRPGRRPLICCQQKKVLRQLPADYFWEVVRQPIHFAETAACLEREFEGRYIDVGPAGTLATFLKYSLGTGSRCTAHATLTPYGLDRRNLSLLHASRT